MTLDTVIYYSSTVLNSLIKPQHRAVQPKNEDTQHTGIEQLFNEIRCGVVVVVVVVIVEGKAGKDTLTQKHTHTGNKAARCCLVGGRMKKGKYLNG